jgi:hypothetical protein
MDADLLLFFKATDARTRGVFGEMLSPPGVLLGFRVLWDCVRVWSARARRELGLFRLLVALVWVCFVLGLRVFVAIEARRLRSE